MSVATIAVRRLLRTVVPAPSQNRGSVLAHRLKIAQRHILPDDTDNGDGIPKPSVLQPKMLPNLTIKVWRLLASDASLAIEWR